VCANVEDLGRGSAIDQPDVQKQFFLAFWESVSESDTPSPVYGRPDSNIYCVSDVFMRYTVRTSKTGGGVEGVFQTDDVGQGGGCLKS